MKKLKVRELFGFKRAGVRVGSHGGKGRNRRNNRWWCRRCYRLRQIRWGPD